MSSLESQNFAHFSRIQPDSAKRGPILAGESLIVVTEAESGREINFSESYVFLVLTGSQMPDCRWDDNARRVHHRTPSSRPGNCLLASMRCQDEQVCTVTSSHSVAGRK